MLLCEILACLFWNIINSWGLVRYFPGRNVVPMGSGNVYSKAEIARRLQCVNSYAATVTSPCDRCVQPGACRLISGTYITTSLGKGYHPVITIPAGACHINITELGNSGNYLALKTTSGTPILNIMWNIKHPGSYEGGGAIFKYSRRGENCPGECIAADGPVQSSLVVQVLYLHDNPGIKYSYQVPPGSHQHSITSQTSWHPSTETTSKRNVQTRISDTSFGDSSKDDNTAKRVASNNNDTSIIQTVSHSFDRVNVSEPATSTTYINDNLNRGVRINNHRQHRPEFTSSFTDSARDHTRYNSASSIRNRQRHQRLHSDRLRHQRRQQLRDVTYYRQSGVDSSPQVIVGDRSASVTSIGNPSRPTDLSNSAEYAVYSWTVSGYTDCSRMCGGGVKKTVVQCVDTHSRMRADRANCDALIPPEIKHVLCNTAPCHPEWEFGDWFPCSTTCGAGQQSRRVVCRQTISTTKSGTVPEYRCLAPKPATSRHCHNDPCYSWEMGKWTKCSVDCGLGSRRRRVRCKNSAGIVVHEKYCNQSAPATEASCDMGSCTQHWYYSKWSGQCSSDCGSGLVSRHVHCATDTGHFLSDDLCDVTKKPASDKPCRQQALVCGGKWFVGPWRSCSPSCGQGTRSRDVICLKHVTTGASAVVNDDQCDTNIKPTTTEVCRVDDCGVQWFMTKWSQCSQSCGGGVKVRAVRCFDKHMEYSSSCSAVNKPATRMDCNVDRCWTLADAAVKSGCRDKYPNCRVVVQARLCRYHFYQRKCCASCSTGVA